MELIFCFCFFCGGSANAIRHLASVEHVKNLKHFFWKYGGAMDQLNAFMVSDDDVAKVLYEIYQFSVLFYG